MTSKQPWEEDWGGSPSTASAPWEEDWGDQTAPLPERETGSLEGTSRSLLQGLTFGFSDEVGAGVAATMAHLSGNAEEDTFADTWVNIMSRLERQRNGFREKHPVLSYGAEGAGAIGTGIAGFGRLVGGKAFETASAWSKLLRLSGVGAVEGGLYGAGSGSPGEKMGAALEGAATGAVVAPVGAGAVNLVGRAGGQAIRATKRRLTDTATSKARRAVLQAAEDEGLSTQEILDVLDELGPNGALIDVGDSFRSLGRAAMDSRGTAKTQARKFVTERQRGQVARLESAVEGISGANGKEYRKTIGEVIARRRDVASPIYKEAEEVGLFARGNLKRVMDNPLFKQSLKVGKTWANAAQSSLKKQIHQGEGVFNQIHFAKQHLDDRIGVAMRKGKTSEARILMGLKNDLMQAIREQNPSYIRANDAFANESALKNALEYGYEKFLKESPELIEESLASMSSAERDLWKMGAVKAVSNMMGKTNLNSDATRRLFGNRDMRQRMGLIFENPLEFERAIAREADFTRTRNALTGGPNTAERLAAQQALQDSVDPGIMAAVAASEPTSAIALAGRALAKPSVDPATASEVGDILLKTGTPKEEIVELFKHPAIKEALGDQYNAVVAPLVRSFVAPVAHLNQN